MGQQGSVLQFCFCQDWARYVINSAHCHSKCGESCCDLEIETHEVEIASGSEEDGVKANVCCF